MGNIIKELRKTRGITQRQLAELLNLSPSTVAMYETGQRKPDSDTLQNIADLFEVSTDYLLGRTDFKFANIIKNSNETLAIPILGVIRAGEPMFAIENIEGYEFVDISETKGGEFFYLRVNGDSMINARILDGDLVYVRKQQDVESGDIAVVIINGYEATLKRVLKTDDSVILQPENPKYKPTVFGKKEIESGYLKIVGKVIHVKFKI